MPEAIREPIEPFGLSLKHRKRTLFSKIGVVGAGREGRNIIRLTSSAGLEVIFIEVNQERIDHCFKRLSIGLDQRVENWGLTPSEKKTILGRIKGSVDYSDLRDCDFVIECIRYDDERGRDTQLRKQAFEQIEKAVSPEAIIATNATTAVISELASGLEHKERCVSLHFPVAHPDATLLEIVKGAYTSEEVYQKVLRFAKLIKYEAISIHESNGLVSKRMVIVMLNEACQMVMENIAKIEDINRLMIVDFGMRLGIFQIADIIGIEKLQGIMEDMFNEYGDKKYKPNPVIWRLFRTKQWGMHVGRGFFLYENDKIVGTNPFFND
jgi:3-hydroxybutyryl-CoA dehydrogenase